MRKAIVAGNWKMNKTPQQAAEFAAALKNAPGFLADAEKAEVLVCPPFIDIPSVSAALSGTPIKVGAQNVHEAKEGAFTGCISVGMLEGLVEYVILGHSEVRRDLGETDDKINKKVGVLLNAGLTPIVAVGESLEQRKADQTKAIVNGQVAAALKGFSAEQVGGLVIAYEPLWAIGSGLACEPDEANRVCADIRALVAEQFGAAAGESIRIQYGGSVTADNMLQYMKQPDIDGALVGGASLKLDSFLTLVRLAIEAKA